MYIGIDVGGTYTDGVILHDGRVIRWTKRPTNSERIRESIESVLGQLLPEQEGEKVKRIVISTTLVTNLLVTNQLETAALVLIPGPGLNMADFKLAEKEWILHGGIDFRGREIESVDACEIKDVGRQIYEQGIRKVAVVGKFCQRNPDQEIQVKSLLQEDFPDLEILMGHEVSGELNFPRRAVTTYYTLTTRREWREFAEEITGVLRAMNINVPIVIMKADGGTMSLSASLDAPCQTIFSGPAASTLGAFALTLDDKTSVVVDIGGTTTDLALILEGNPLHASKGAKIGEKYTHVKALAVRSMALGGDSRVRIKEGQISIGPDRQGRAACFGGPGPTPTDAFNIISKGEIGDVEESRMSLACLCCGKLSQVEELAQNIVNLFIEMINDNVQIMMRAWEQEPAYKVWEIVNRRSVTIERVIGIGAASPAVIPLLALRMGCEGFINSFSTVGNALGAVVARPTLELHLHADTEEGVYCVNGQRRKLDNPESFRISDAKHLIEEELEAQADSLGMADYYKDRQFFLEEQFNVIRGWSTTNRIFDLGISISPGVVNGYKGVKP
ncbi:MAG: hydantoinase/oxoprolinase family protein [Syntrophomonadaceae bacterium]|nr:hydantoinase/oxoprolinase family protein [Syntrophomonadaceae bacterium]